MKTIFILVGIVFLASCAENNGQKVQNNGAELKSEFEKYFLNKDTVQQNYTIGCSAGFYQLLNTKYVLRIYTDLDFENNTLKTFQVSPHSLDITLELFEFEEGQANLTNICTDIHLVNAVKPIRTYSDCSGTVVVGISNPATHPMYAMPIVSMHLDGLTFYDSLGVEKLRIENEMIWKVQHQGTPG
jgi:hypothetical protein